MESVVSFRNVDSRLISLIANFPSIYDKQDELYKDFDKKQETWEGIGKELNLDGETVKKRWENLRDRFVRVYRDYVASENKSLAKSKFKFFDQMLWLAPHIRKRRMTAAVLAHQSSQNIQNQMNLNFIDNTNKMSDITNEEHIKVETQSNISEGTGPEPFLEEEPLLSSTSVQEPILQNVDSFNKSDEHFMLSVIHDCQGMPPRKKLKFRRDVLELLEKYLYGEE